MKKIQVILIGILVLMVIAYFISSYNQSSSDEILTEEFSKEMIVAEKHDNIMDSFIDSVEVEGLYSMVMSGFMYSTNDLNDIASLQYNNISQENYIIVINEGKQEFIDAFKESGEFDDSMPLVDYFASIQIDSFSENASIYSETEFKDMTFHGMPAKFKKVTATVPNIDQKIVYWFAYVEGKDNLYTMMAWALESGEKEYDEHVMKMFKSIKEL